MPISIFRTKRIIIQGLETSHGSQRNSNNLKAEAVDHSLSYIEINDRAEQRSESSPRRLNDTFVLGRMTDLEEGTTVDDSTW
jgi:hypothetical protein